MRSCRIYGLFILLLVAAGLKAQDCTIKSRANDILPDRFCSPVSVNWEIYFRGVNDGGAAVEIWIDWGDGDIEIVPAVKSMPDTLNIREWGATVSHTYISEDDKCNYHPTATLMVDGDLCTSSTQEQIVTVWDNDDSNGGELAINPQVYPICVGNGDNVQFEDATLFNCVPPQEEDAPNLDTRWVQWIYGTDITFSGSNTTVNGNPVSFEYHDSINVLPGPVTGSGLVSGIINVSNDHLIGEYFEVVLRYWNYCNPYDDPLIPGPPADSANGDHPPVTDTAIILIVPPPNATIDPVPEQCLEGDTVFLTAADNRGLWSGPGIVDGITGAFLPLEAGPGDHIINYKIVDGNTCEDEDTVIIRVLPAPDGTFVPVGPFCIDEAEITLIPVNPGGIWSGRGITNPVAGTYLPLLAGPGLDTITYRVIDIRGCTGTDTTIVDIKNLPQVSFDTLAGICVNAASITLNQGLPAGGTYSGPGITGLDIFDPSIADSGLHLLSYEYTDANNCTASASRLIRVFPLPEVTLNPVPPVCADADTLFLDQGFPAGGSYQGPGIFASPFLDPQLAGPGNHTLIYSYVDTNSCSNTDSVQLLISPVPVITLNPIDPVCLTDDPVNLLMADPPGGSYSGPGVTGGLFDAGAAGTGLHEINYVYTDIGGCSDSVSFNLEVMGIPDAEILSPDSSWCLGPDNRTQARIFVDGYRNQDLELVFDNQGLIDTFQFDFTGIYSLPLNNTEGLNLYRLLEVAEYHGDKRCSLPLDDSLRLQVHPLPDATLNVDYPTACSPVLANFSSTSEYKDYIWDFGDGDLELTDTSSIEHLYFNNRDSLIRYEISLIVRSVHNCKDTAFTQVEVYPRPEANFEALPEVQQFPSNTVSLQNRSKPGNWNYFWVYGDGTTDTLKNPGEHSYDAPGFYDISLKTYNLYCADSLTKTIRILPPPPIAGFRPDTTGCPPLEVKFRNESLYAESYLWDFDDGSFSAEADPVHTFYDSREYEVTLTVFGPSGQDQISRTIKVFPKPQAVFSVYPTEAINADQIFKFLNNSINAAKYYWEFGDGTHSLESDPSHVYGMGGNFNVSLTIWSPDNCPDSITLPNPLRVVAGDGYVQFPNVFKWNGYGPTGGYWSENEYNNTIFHPQVMNVTEFKMVIFTRWGEAVYESNELKKGWDGYLRTGERAAQGVYVYKVWVTYISGRKEMLVGDVTFLY